MKGLKKESFFLLECHIVMNDKKKPYSNGIVMRDQSFNDDIHFNDQNLVFHT